MLCNFCLKIFLKNNKQAKINKYKHDYTSNVIGERTYPRGLDVEVFSFKVLEFMYKNCKQKAEREHVTWHIVNNLKNFKTSKLRNYRDLSYHRWTLDEKDDFKLIKKVFEELYPTKKQQFDTTDILSLFERQPKLLQINSHIEQKKVKV